MDFTLLKETLDSMIEKRNVPGVDCIVYKEHEEIFRYFAGCSNRETKKPMNGQELYIIFSMTKMLTCTCALQLFEQGKFSMDDPVSKYIKEFETMEISEEELYVDNAAKVSSGASAGEEVKAKAVGIAKNPITIRHLFTMSAGLNYDLKSPCIVKALEEGKKTTGELVRAMGGMVLSFEPGTRFRYSLCHDVLGHLIEIWSGKKFGDYMKENVLKPLGMNDTFFGVPKDEERRSRLAKKYRYDGMEVPILSEDICIYNFTDDYESGGAGLISCPSDYAVFLDALANGGVAKNGHRILSTSSVELMRTNQLTGQRSKDFYNVRKGYGYGLGVRTHIDPEVSGSLSPVGEFGWDGAAGAFSMVDPKNKLSLTYFQEVMGWDLAIQNEIRNALYKCLENNEE